MKILISLIVCIVFIAFLIYHFALDRTIDISKEINLMSNKIIFEDVFYIEEWDSQNQDGPKYLEFESPSTYGLSKDLEIDQVRKKRNSVIRKIEIGEKATVLKIERKTSNWSGVYEYLIIEINSNKYGNEKIKVGMRHFFQKVNDKYVKTNAFSYQK